MIEIEINETLLLFEEDIVEEEGLTKSSTNEEIEDGVYDYILGLDDVDYRYAIKHKKEITQKVKDFLQNS